MLRYRASHILTTRVMETAPIPENIRILLGADEGEDVVRGVVRGPVARGHRVVVILVR